MLRSAEGFRVVCLAVFVPHLHSAIILNTELPPNLDWTSKSLGNHAQIGREGFLPERDY